MKIDLHLHTKKTAAGDPITREIKAEKFKKQLKDANIGIAAITNHYFFDEKQYQEMCDDAYTLLPGVELDINIKNKRVQANVIVHPKDINDLKKLLDEIENDKNPISYENFSHKFNKNKWIICLDYKNSGNTSWKQEDMLKAIEDMDKSFVLVDTNKATTLMVLNSHNFNALIGSDITNWDEYQEKSSELISTKLNIKDYDRFWSILKYKENNINELFKNVSEREFKDIEMPNTKIKSNNYFIKNLKIKQGVNVIFGAKRTGKTEILKHIRNNTNTKNSYYISSYKDTAIEELEKEMLNENLFIENKNNFEKILNEILKYKETSFNKFSDFYLSMIGNTKISFHNKLSVIKIDPFLNDATKKQVIEISKLKKSIQEANIAIKNLEIKNFGWKKIIKEILNNAWKIYKNIYKESWKININIEIKKRIDSILQKNSGIKPKPRDIGLFKRYSEKQMFKNSLENLEKTQKEFSNKLKSFKIPGRNKVYASQLLYFIDFHKLTNKEKFKNKGKINEINKQIKKLKKEKFFFDFNEVIKAFKNFSEDLTDYFSEFVKIRDEKNNSNFSNGEKAHLLLHEKLNKDVEYYILDEPGVFLSKESITHFLLPKIAELSKEGKKIIIVTHNSSLGINTIPINYIYRKYVNENDECQTYFGTIWENKFTNIKNSDDKLDFQDEIIGRFEGSEKHFKFRKGVYENKV